MTNPRFMFCDDLNSPLLCIIMDTAWFAEWMADGGKEWLADRGAHEGYGMLIMDEVTKVELVLKWG